MRRPPLTIAVLVLALTLAITLAAAEAFSATERPTVAGISQSLTCQCGCGLTVANCNHPTCSFSVPVRGEIEAMIARGKSGNEIVAFYRMKYGEKVLSAPTTEGFNILAWVMPFVALLLGGAFIVYTASRWRSAPAVGTEPDAAVAKRAASQFDPELRHRLENEVREHS